MNPILIALIAVGALALIMATKKKALAAGTGVNSGSPYDEVGGSTYDPNAPEGPPPPPPPPKKKTKRYGPTLIVDPMREKFKGLTVKEGSMHSARHFGLHTRPLPSLPAEGDTNAWFALYNSDNFDDLTESVRVAMRAVTHNVQMLLERNQYTGDLGIFVPAWTPELSTAGGIGAAAQAALIQLAMDKRRKAAAEAPDLYAQERVRFDEGKGPSNEWRGRTEIAPLEAPMMTIISEALIAAVPNHTYAAPARQGEIDAVANELWGQLRGAHARGETQLLFSEMFQSERNLVRDKVKTLWNEASAAIDNPGLLPPWDDISHVLRDRVVAGMLLNVLRGEAIIGGNSPRPGVFGMQDFIQFYIEKAAEQAALQLLSEFPEMTLEEAEARAAEEFGLSGLSADAISDGADVIGGWEEYVPTSL